MPRYKRTRVTDAGLRMWRTYNFAEANEVLDRHRQSDALRSGGRPGFPQDPAQGYLTTSAGHKRIRGLWVRVLDRP